jgi:cbb3-type cytochrome oxidase subunit 1
MAAKSIPGFKKFEDVWDDRAPLGWDVTELFGAMYYIVPRMVGREWRYATLIKIHFWSAAYGIGLMTLMLVAAGFAEGGALDSVVASVGAPHKYEENRSHVGNTRRHTAIGSSSADMCLIY